MKTTLLVMALNEIDGMKAVMPKIDPGWVDQIVVCDGGSTDGTAEWAWDQLTIPCTFSKRRVSARVITRSGP